MTLPVQNLRAGTCPHGCPMGACPICNGMSGGGMPKKNDAPKKNEMSWSECYAIWQKMLAKKAEKAQEKDVFMNNNASQNNITQSASSSDIKGAMHPANVSANTKPAVSVKSKNIFVNAKNSVLNFAQKIGATVVKFANFIKETALNIMDKLAAIFGEAKNFTEKKILDNLKNLPKKLFKLFGLYEVENEDEDEKRIEEEKRALEMKKIKETLIAPKEGLEDDQN